MTPVRQRALVLVLIIIGVSLAGFFGFRFLRAIRHASGHPPLPLPAAADSQTIETDPELIRDWMTIPFIAITYDLPPNLLYEALGISPRGNEEKSLNQLNEEYFPESPGMVIEIVKALARASEPPPTAPSPPTVIP